MKCPYQDIGCWYIDDVSHECEARTSSDCSHESEQESKRRPHNDEEENK